MQQLWKRGVQRRKFCTQVNGGDGGTAWKEILAYAQSTTMNKREKMQTKQGEKRANQ